MLRRSQVCSALRFFSLCSKKLGLALCATAAQRWAAQLFFFFGLLSSAVGQFGAHGLKPMVVGLCKERAEALVCYK